MVWLAGVTDARAPDVRVGTWEGGVDLQISFIDLEADGQGLFSNTQWYSTSHPKYLLRRVF
jgi:hypothetical protein